MGNTMNFQKTFGQASKTVAFFKNSAMSLNISVVVYGKKNDNNTSTVMTSYTSQSNDGKVKENYNIIPNIYLGFKISDNNSFKDNASVFLSAQNMKLMAGVMRNMMGEEPGYNPSIQFNDNNKISFEKVSATQYILYLNDGKYFVSLSQDDFYYIQEYCEHADIINTGMNVFLAAILLSNDQAPVASSGGNNYNQSNNNAPKVTTNSSTKNNTTFSPSNKSSATIVENPNDDDIPF